MKKSILIGLIFILIRVYCYSTTPLIEETIISVSKVGSTQSEAKLIAENDYRRKILEYLLRQYRDALGEYFIFLPENHSFDRDLVNELVKSGFVIEENNNQKHCFTIQLTASAFDKIYSKYSKPPHLSLGLFQRVDHFITYPSVTHRTAIDSLVQFLQAYQVENNHSFMIYKEQHIDMLFTTQSIFRPVLDITFGDRTIQKRFDQNNQLSMRVHFTSNNQKPDDIFFPSNKPTRSYSLSFTTNVEKTFNLNKLNNKAFFLNLLQEYFPNEQQKIDFFIISDSHFYISSDNLPEVIPYITSLIQKKGWQSGNKENHTHRIIISRVLEEKKTLLIGSHYLRGHISLVIYDKQNNLVFSSQTQSYEAIDNASFDNAIDKLNKKLFDNVYELKL